MMERKIYSIFISLFILSASLLVSPGCTGDDSEERVAFVHDSCFEDVDEFIDIYSTAICHYWSRCPQPLSLVIDHDPFTCKKLFTFLLEAELPAFSIDYLINNNQTCILKSEVNAVIKDMWMDECRPLWFYNHLHMFFQGTLPVGAECMSSASCKDGYCRTEYNCWGECIPKRNTGDSCYQDYECGLGHICFNEECTSFKDIRWASAGQDCIWSVCDYGLYCAEGKCRRWGEYGETCDEIIGSCAPGLACNPFENRCEPIVRVTTEGAPCGYHLSAISGNFGACELGMNLVCALDQSLDDGVCIRLPSEGELCNFYPDKEDYNGECMWPDLFCDGNTGVCMKRKEVGEVCENDHECLTNSCIPRADSDISMCFPESSCF